MKPWLVLFLFFWWPVQAMALPLENFGSLPIAHEGRIKPISVFAREELLKFSGEKSWRKASALQWLALMVFTPESMDEKRLIKVESKALRQMLKLPPHVKSLYSIKNLREAMRPHARLVVASMLAIQQKQAVTPLQESLVELYALMQQFQELQDSINMYLPLPRSEETTYLQAKNKMKTLSPKVSAVIAQMEERGRQNRFFAIVPSPWPDDEDWYSPWSLRFNGVAAPQTETYLNTWKNMASAFRSNDAERWVQSIDEAHAIVAELGSAQYHPLRLKLEEWYYRLSFLSLAICGYAAFLLGSALSKSIYMRIPLVAGISCHALALAVRMLILQRPPVSNLYESLLFVSLLLLIAGTFLGWRQQKPWLLQASAAMGILLLLVSQTLLSGQEQLPVVMAVLNTDFWLATHVICITSGYAASVLVSLLAHYALWNRQDSLRLQGYVLVALLLTAVGTLLGGIWADQSWGRFWGWDPKENGALLIVLWLIWLLHGRLAGQIRERWYLAGMAYLGVIVSLAWFGVNLLSVGLHSYGFTEGTAWGLIGFIAAETTLIAWLLWRNKRKDYA